MLGGMAVPQLRYPSLLVHEQCETRTFDSAIMYIHGLIAANFNFPPGHAEKCIAHDPDILHENISERDVDVSWCRQNRKDPKNKAVGVTGPAEENLDENRS